MESGSDSADSEIIATDATLSQYDVIIFNNYTKKTPIKIQNAIKRKQKRDFRYFKSLSFHEQYLILNFVFFTLTLLKHTE